MSDLSSLIVKLIDGYKREPDAAFRAINDMTFVFTDEIDDTQLLSAIGNADRLASTQLAQMASITAPDSSGLVDSAPDARANITPAELKLRLAANKLGLEAEAGLAGMSPEDYENERTILGISTPNVEATLLIRLVTQLGEVVPVLEALAATDFRKIRSEAVSKLVEEAHFCFLMGLESGAAILFWAAIELALKELLTKRGVLDEREKITVWQLLNDAEKHLDLPNAIRVDAQLVYDLRKLAVHDWPKFDREDISKRTSLTEKSRQIITEIYKLDVS